MPEAHHRTAESPPWPALLLAVVGLAVLGLPIVGLLTRTPWGRLGSLVSDPVIATTLRLSLWCATCATALSLVLGVPLAWWLATSRSRMVSPARVLVTLPLVLPPVVGGVALMSAFGRTSPLGRWLDASFGVQLPFSTTAVVLAEAFVAMPFLVTSLEGALRQRDVELEEAAATAGAGRWQTLRHVTLPLAWPSLAAGLVLCWARALGEFGATITFAGNFPGRTQTMPLAVYLAMQTDPDRAIALSVLLLLVSATVLLCLRGHWWRAGTQ